MRLLIFILALTSAFFVSANPPEGFPSDRYVWPGVQPDSKIFYECYTSVNGPHSKKVQSPSECIEWAYNIRISQPDMSPFCKIERTTIKQQTDTYFSQTLEKYASNSNGCIVHRGYDSFNVQWTNLPPESPTCPPESHPLHTFPWPQTGSIETCHKPLDVEPEPDLDPDCPAPTDNDPFVFGTGQQQTICFDNPDGSQCSIETDENGNFYMPVSYGSQEPVACTEIDPTDPDPTDPDPTDPDPTDPDPTDPDPTDPDPTDPDKTPEPDPTPEPEPTDDTEASDLLPALNQVNKNLDAINTNMNNGFESNHDRLDRVAEEIQISNKLANEHVYESKAIKDAIIGANEITLGILQDMKNGVDSIGTAISKTNSLVTEGNEKLDKISDGINSTFEEGTCIGDLCSLDLSKELDEFDKSFEDFVNDEKDQKVPREFEAYLNRLDSYVSSAFSGFTGQCVPFDIRVSIRNVERVISVGEHCPYYEDYFKPVIEWFLYVMTFVSVLNITSQSFRAFSTV